MVKEMDEKRIKDDVRCVRDFIIWSELLRRNFKIVDINKDKKFVCPILGEKCTFKSVVYFEVVDGLDETIEQLYKELEESKRG